MSNDHDNTKKYNNNVNNETNDSSMIVHIAKRILPTKKIQLIDSNTSNMSTITTFKDNASITHDEININGTKYRLVDTLNCYSRNITKTRVALIDRGANGGLAGDDVRLVSNSSRIIHVQGIDNHQCINIPIVTAGAVTKS